MPVIGGAFQGQGAPSIVEQQALAYGTNSRPTPTVLLKWSFYVCLVAGLCASSIVYGFRRFYYHDRDAVRAHLAALPGVSVDEIEGFDDVGEWNVAYATLSIKGKPGSRLSFASPDQVLEGKEVRLSAIGPYELQVSSCDYGSAVDAATGRPVASQFSQNWFDIGPGGAFSDLSDTPIRGAGHVVNNYDALLAAIKAMPKSGRRKLKDGSEVEWEIIGP
jgi:hypothetical protein